MADSKTIQVTLKAVADIKDVQSNIQQIQKGLAGLQLPEALRTQFTKTFSALEKNAEKASAALATGFKDKGSVTAYRKATDAIVADMQKVAELTGKIDSSKLTFEVGDPNRVKTLTAQIEQLKKDIDSINTKNLEAVTKVYKDKPSDAGAWKAFFEAFQSGDIEGAEKALKRLQIQVKNHADQVKAATNPEDTWYKYANGVRVYEEALSIMKGETGEATEKEKELAAATQELEKIQIDANNAGQESLRKYIEEIVKATIGTKEFAGESQQSAEATNKLSNSLSNFKDKVSYFFGLNNAVHMFQRAVQSAMDTVKDLDAVMTETAVVTEFDVGDMWSQLPEYTKRANELGVSIHDAYEAATLYYQQGLSTNEVMAVSNETLKMARIAGLDAADATDRMTNALRGFNMAITEANAQNINDVYSNLAAKTASNVDEISTAMTKVASLANNANMSFENTAAFLSQIIETTRESAETAGTALKTVIARFSEVKSLYSEGELLGTDTEGEEINVNKVSAALRTAGINLNEYLTGMKGLDDIFMELSKKWDSLDQVQQRYIATMAAGSRQQSRFIALMQDYGRMTELVGEANNAAGASQKQFEKTLESFQTKVERLKNAWDTFLMGIANSDIIKGVIDILTKLVSVLNKVLEGTSGIGKSIASIGMVIGTGLLGKGIFSKITTGLPGLFGDAAKESSTSFLSTFAKGVKGHWQDFIKGDAFNIKNLIDMSNFEEIKNTFSSLSEPIEKAKTEVLAAEDAFNFATLAMGDEIGPLERMADAYDSLEDANNKLAESEKALGITQDQLNQWAKAGYTDQEQAILTTLKQQGALEGLEDTENKDTAAKIRAMIAEKQEQAVAEQGISIRILSTLQTKLHTAAVAEIPVVSAVAAKWERILGNEALSTGAKMLISLGIIGAIIAAVALLVAGIALLVKHLNDISPEGQMAKVEERTRAATEAAQEATTAYDELNNSLTGIKEQYETIENLTKGTDEWREATQKLNGEIIELVGKYKELGQYVTFEDGVLKISNEGMQTVEQSYKRRETAAQAEVFSAESARTDEIIRQAIMKSDTGAFASFLDEDQKATEEYLRQLREGTLTMEQFEKIVRDYYGLREEEITFTKDAELALAELAVEAGKASASLEGSAAIFVSKISEDAGLSDQGKVYASNFFNRDNLNRFSKLAEEQYAKVGREDLRKELAEREGYSSYADWKAGANEGKDITDDEIRKRLASYSMAESTSEIAKRLEGVKADSLLGRFLSGKSTKEDYQNYGGEDIAKALAAVLGGGASNFVAEAKQFDINKQNTQNEENKVRADFGKKGIYGARVIDQIGLEAAGGVSNQIKDFGIQNAQAYVNSFLETIKSVSADKQQGLAEFIAGIDFTDLTKYGANLDELVNTYGLTREAAIKFYNDAASKSKAYIKSVESALQMQEMMKESFDKIGEAQDRLTEGKGTKEDVDMLIAAGVDASVFEMTADGWKANTEAIKEYIKALREAAIADQEFIIQQNEATFREFSDLTESEQKDQLIAMGYLDEADKDNYKAIQEALNKYREEYGKEQVLLQKQLDYSRAQTYTAEENYATGGSEKSVIMSAKREATDLGVSEEEFNGYVDVIKQQAKDAGNELDDMHASLTALGAAKTVKGLQGLVDTQKDWTKVVKKGSLETTAEIKVFNDFKKNVNLLVGSNEDLSDSFYKSKKNIALLEKAVKGDENAIQDLRQAAAADIIINAKTDTSTAVLKQFADYVRNYDLPSLEVGVELDKSKYADFYDNCNAMAEKAGMTADQVIEYFRAMGYDATVRVVKKKVTTMQGVISYDDSAQGWHEGQIPVETEMEVPVVETLTSLGSKGGGVNFDEKNGGGGGGSDKTEHWENPYDELYNLQEKINEALRTRERLEREYQKLLKSETATNAQIRKDYFTQIASLREEIKLQEQLASGRLRQIKKLNKEIYEDDEGKRTSFEDLGVTKYANYNEKTGLITIDWEGLEKIEADPNRVKEGEAVEAYIGKLEELVSSYEETRDTIWDMEDTIQELADEAIESYMSFEERVYDAVVSYYERAIDEFESLSNTIDSSTDKVLDGISSQIEAERQMRENEKTEQEIADKESRLAYLSRDTSGANALEILQLQKELEEKRQGYEDQLIDQALQQMKDDADLAAEQRATQIEVMRAQLQVAQDYGELWPEVYELINNAIGKGGELNLNSDLVAKLQDMEAFKALSAFGQDEWIKTLVEEFHKAEEGVAAGNAAKAGEHQNTIKPPVGSSPTSNSVSTNPSSSSSSQANASSSGSAVSSTVATNPYGKFSDTTGVYGQGSSGDAVKSLQWAMQQLGYDIGSAGIDGKFGPATAAALKKFQRDSGISADGIAGNDTRAAFRAKGYLEGGLADYTGPAWLDGTRAKPEAVLSAADTQNFISLRNILASIFGGQGVAGNFNGGDNYYNIDITAELGSDYDVDQLADKIKRQIQEDGMYRNVNAISYIR